MRESITETECVYCAVRTEHLNIIEVVKCSEDLVRWIEGLSNRMFIIIRIYKDQKKFDMAFSFFTFFQYSFGSIFSHYMYGSMY